MRRNRKPRVVWLPPTNANSFGQSATSGIKVFALNTTEANPHTVGEIPLVIDSQDDPLDPNTSLADVESSGYRLRRIVGKIWITNDGSDENTASFGILTAGLIVRRSNPATGQSYALTSTGADSLLSPQEIPNYGDPWIWRRSWRIANTSSVADARRPNIPVNNFGNGPSAVDGPHVDQKTARIVGPEERLFLDVAVRQNTEGAGEIPIVWNVVCDLRVLGSMRTSSGNRRNASR